MNHSCLRALILVYPLIAFSFAGCSDSQSATAQVEDAKTKAEISDADERAKALEALGRALAAEADAVQSALLDPANDWLRDDPSFRRAIREASVKHKISQLTLARPEEPGEWLEIEGEVIDADKKPIAGAVVDVFGTDEKGNYHPTIEGESTPRLFGVLVADDEGKFSFRTIRPGPYPGTRNARHFHIWATAAGKRMAVPHYAVLSDDPLLDEPQNAEQRGEAIRVIMQPKRADGVATGKVVLPMR
ncbi:MAG: hypothetical protein ABL888_05370 [Pirellulaceae bacterium]